MKVSIVTILSNDDGNVELTVKPFLMYEKAAKFLFNQYEEIKEIDRDKIDYAIDDKEDDEHGLASFQLEDKSGLYWCNGTIYTMEVR